VIAHHDWGRLFGRPILATVEHALVGNEELYSHGWRLDGKPLLPSASAPVIGEHTREVLTEYAGFDAASIERLEVAGVLS